MEHCPVLTTTRPKAGLPGARETNTAHIAVRLPGVGVEEVGSFLVSVEHFLHLNPHLEIRAWEQLPHDRVFVWRLLAFNELNGALSDRTVWIRPLEQGQGYRLEYREGIKEATLLHWWADGQDTVVEIQESYRLPKEGGAGPPLSQVDGSLAAWAASLADHFLLLHRWGNLPLYRWYRLHRWLNMTPAQRRAMAVALWTIPLELALVVVVLYFWLG